MACEGRCCCKICGQEFYVDETNELLADLQSEQEILWALERVAVCHGYDVDNDPAMEHLEDWLNDMLTKIPKLEATLVDVRNERDRLQHNWDCI